MFNIKSQESAGGSAECQGLADPQECTRKMPGESRSATAKRGLGSDRGPRTTAQGAIVPGGPQVPPTWRRTVHTGHTRSTLAGTRSVGMGQ